MKIFYEFSDFDLKAEIPEAFRKYFSENWGKVKTSNYCGSMKIGDETISILPKINRVDENANMRYLVYMLSFVYDLNVEETASATDTEQSPIIELLISVFCRDLLVEVERGLYREYISCQENIRTLKGRYLTGLDARHNLFRDKIYCEYDEFSPDNYLNALFAHTVKFCRQITKSDENRKRLSALALMFDEVDTAYQKKPFVFGRLNERFKKPYSLATLILEHLSVNIGAHGKSEWAFMFDMNVLFEQFVGKLIKQIDHSALLQSERNFGNLKLRPDILIPNKLIIDTKYKLVSSKEEISAQDKYQMYAYGKNFGIENTMLLYPKHLDGATEILQLGELEKCVMLRMDNVQLNIIADSFCAYIENIKNQLRGILNG